MPSRKKNKVPDINPQIGLTLANIRKEKGLTQQNLAEIAGISQQQLSHYENGNLHMSAEMVVKFAQILKVPADRILGLSDQKVENNISLKLTRRMSKIETLPESEQRALLKTIDIYLRGSE